jgi:inosose dehydratase
MPFRFGFQTYTWQMSYDKYADKLPHILQVIQAAGGEGVEPEVCMMGQYHTNPELLHADLEKRQLQLGALCLALEWRHEQETAEEQTEADRVIAYLRHFPGTLLILAQLQGNDRSELAERQANALLNINAVAKRSYEQGIRCAFHPNSPAGSVFRTEEDYQVLIEGLDPAYCGYAADTGHIANGGMDVMQIFRKYRSFIEHVHFKDRISEGRWSAMGDGSIDHLEVVLFLHETNYNGWIMVEEESVAAVASPDQATLANGKYMQVILKGTMFK